MGYSAYSKVVFGLIVSKDDITVETNVRSCSHDTDLNANFCSVCGQAVYETEETMLVEYGYDPNQIAYFVSSHDSDEEGILGFVIAQTEDQDTSYHVIPQPSEKMISELKKFLNEHEIEFSDNELKSYLYTEHSY